MHTGQAACGDISRTRTAIVKTNTAYDIPAGQNVTVFQPAAATPFTATLPPTRDCIYGLPYECRIEGAHKTDSAVTISCPAGETVAMNDVVLDTDTSPKNILAVFIPTVSGWVCVGTNTTP